MVIPRSNEVAYFYTVSYNEMVYGRGGFSQMVQKKYRLFELDGDRMKLLPTAPYVMSFNGLKKFSTEPKLLKGNLIDVQYTGIPTDEQVNILDNIKERSTKYGYNAGLIVMKTGRGKSHIIAQVLDYHKEKTIISVHNIKTLQEMEAKIKQFCKGKFTVGVYYGAKKKMGDVIIITHTSLSKNGGKIIIKGKVFKPNVLLYDEADRNLSPAMISAFCNMNISYMYGLTGTPNAKNLQEKDLNKIFGKSIRSKFGGYNLVPIVKYIRYRTEEDYLFTNYHELRECLIEDEGRFKAQVKYIKHVMKYRQCGLLMSDRRIEVEKYYEELKGEDYEVILVHGDTKVKDDSEAIENSAMSGKKTLIIGTSGKMSRGVDIPPIDTIFLFYPNKFESATIQAVGRGLRNFEGKENTLLVDWCDFPIMKNQMYARWKTYRNEYNIDIDKNNEAKAI